MLINRSSYLFINKPVRKHYIKKKIQSSFVVIGFVLYEPDRILSLLYT